MLRCVCLSVWLLATDASTSPMLPPIKTSSFSVPMTPRVTPPPTSSVKFFGYAPVFIPGTNLPYVYTPVQRWEGSSVEQNVTGFARFISTKGVYGFTPLIGDGGMFLVCNLTAFPPMFSSLGESIAPVDMLPVYSFPTRSSILPTGLPVGFIPLFATSGVEQKKSLSSMVLDSSGRNTYASSSGWDSNVFKSIKPLLYVVRPSMPVTTGRFQTTPRPTSRFVSSPSAVSTVPFPTQFGSLFLTVSPEGVLRVVTNSPSGPPIGRINVFSNETNTTNSFFIPVFPGKNQ